ncbi:MAG TPA: protease modulator HflC [Caulobacteraceae bacterium]|jgi:membrane protease subunit HflC
MNRRLVTWGLAVLGVLILLANTLFVVGQTEQAVVTRLGEPVRVVNMVGRNTDPGLKIKAPFIENVAKFDKRNLALETDEEEIIAADQERLVVDAFVRYRINDPLQFFRTLRDQRTANDRLERLFNSSLRQVLGSAASNDIISARRGELMRRTAAVMDRSAASSRLGIDIIDVRIKRADLPPQNQEAVYRRMETARQQMAATIRARGEQQKREIISAADRDVAITVAQAQQYAGQVQGEGDARRAEIFAQSFGRDPSFASFYRSMQAYENALARGDTTMVISPDSAFFRYYQRGAGGG